MAYYPLHILKPVATFVQKVPGALSAFARTSVSFGAAVASMINKVAGTLTIGEPVYVSAAGAVQKARANAAGTTRVLGFAKATVAADAAVDIQTGGVIELTTAQWDAVAGTTGGLTAGTVYYLSSATAGRITATAPNTQNHYVVELGVALSATRLQIDIKAPVIVP